MLTDWKRPSSGSDCPNTLSPQQDTVPFILTPQAYLRSLLMLTDLKLSGWDAMIPRCPSSSIPQQSIFPLVRMPQVWPTPAVTSRNSPAGGVARPGPLSPRQITEPLSVVSQVRSYPELTGPSYPKQTTLPLVFIPQVWLPPALTEWNDPAGGVACPVDAPA